MRKQVIFALVIALGSSFFFVLPGAQRPFASRGESREAVVVKNMVQSGDYLLPLRNGRDLPSKPPLFHWLGAGLSKLGAGLNEFAVRAPSGLSAGIALGIFFLFACAELGAFAGLIATMLLGSSLEWNRYATLARVDMVFTFFQLLAFILMHRAFRQLNPDKHPSIFYLLGIGLCLGLATLTKGPAGLVLPWLACLVYLYFASEPKMPIFRRFPLLFIVSSMLFSVLIALCWYLPAYQQGGQAFLDLHLMRENIARITGNAHYDTGHEGPFYNSIIFLFVGYLPWSIFLPPLAWNLFKRRAELRRPEERLILFSLTWVLSSLVFFSLTSSKRSVYLLPIFPALSLLLATYLKEAVAETVGEKRYFQFVSWLFQGLSFVLLIAVSSLLVLRIFNIQLPLALWIHSPLLLEEISFILEIIKENSALIILFFFAALAFRDAGIRFYYGLRAGAVHSITLAVLLIVLSLNLFVLPPLSEWSSPRSFIKEALKIIPPRTELLQYRNTFYSALFYTPENIRFVADETELRSSPPSYFLISDDELPHLKQSNLNYSILKRSSGFAALAHSHLYLARVN